MRKSVSLFRVLGVNWGFFARLIVAALVLWVAFTSGPAQARPRLTRTELPYERETRVVVRLHEAPLVRGARMPRVGGHVLDLATGKGAHYLRGLRLSQKELGAAIQRALPGSVIERAYEITFNGLVVRVPKYNERAIEILRSLPGVSAAYDEAAFGLTLYASLPAIRAQELWQEVGGSEFAGSGIKIAILDSGIEADHPMFDGRSFAYPPGYPRGDARFTTSKVIAARAYFRAGDPPLPGEETPVPGPSGSGHGTHVAGIAAGNGVLASYRGLSQEISGVAPRAWLMNYRIFYPSENQEGALAYTAEIVQAIEDAVLDGADILCCSWASVSPRLPFASPVAEALESAIEAGCVVIAAAGNDGPGYGSASRIPGGMERVITVGAATKSEVVAWDLVDVVGPEAVSAELQGKAFSRATFGGEIDSVVGPLPYAGVDAADPFACEPLPEGALGDMAAVIPRGECNFADKAYHTQTAGASLALVYNETDDLVEMGCGGEYCDPGEIVIPVVMVSRSFGESLLEWVDDHPEATLQLDPNGRIVPSVFGTVPSTSGRGPAYARYLKPDVVAPGVSVLSAHHDATSAAAPYAQLGGTSAACAHVAGSAALLLRARPAWGHDEIKAALMATSRTSGLHCAGPSVPAGVLDRGAGLLDLSKAASPGLLISPASVSVSRAAAGGRYEVKLTVRDAREGGGERTYLLSAEHGEGITISVPSEVSTGAGSAITFGLVIDIQQGVPAGDLEADLRMVSGEVEVHVPVWVHVAPSAKDAEVLLIDNDFSYFAGYVDYAPYLLQALDDAGLSYDVWNADEVFDNPQTVPHPEELQRYGAVIWLTGDNPHPDGYYVVSTPLTAIDMQVLAGYLDGGGRIMAIGQNLAEASDVNENEDPTWGRSSFYHSYLGAHWVQGSLFDPTGQGGFPPQGGVGAVGLPDSFLAGVELHLGPVGDGASNQRSVDEIAPGGFPDGSDLDLVKAVMVGVEADPLAAGYISLVKSEEPTLEDETISCPYRSAYYSFGFEGINDTPDTTTRAELLRRTMDWLLDELTVSLQEEIVTSANVLTTITCTASSSVGAPLVSYRWRLGEGEAVVVPSREPAISHLYSATGLHPISVEVTDSLGHKAVAHGTVAVMKGGSSSLVASPSMALRGGEIVYRVVAVNTEAAPISLSFSLPLPPDTEYVSHAGGTFAEGALIWSGVLPLDASFGAEVCVRVRWDVQPNSDIVATAQFQAEGDGFTRSVRSRILAPVFTPLILKQRQG